MRSDLLSPRWCPPLPTTPASFRALLLLPFRSRLSLQLENLALRAGRRQTPPVGLRQARRRRPAPELGSIVPVNRRSGAPIACSDTPSRQSVPTSLSVNQRKPSSELTVRLAVKWNVWSVQASPGQKLRPSNGCQSDVSKMRTWRPSSSVSPAPRAQKERRYSCPSTRDSARWRRSVTPGPEPPSIRR